MNPDLLRTTWTEASRHGDHLVNRFYSTLFLAHPEVRRLFGDDLTEQRKKLAATLNLVVRSVDNLDAVVPVLQRLGCSHRRFGAVEAHYAAVGEALLATLAHYLGDAWTTETRETWTEAYGTVAQVMIDAARDHDHLSIPKWWDSRILYVERQRDVAYIVFKAPDLGPLTEKLTVPVALHGTPGNWLPVQPFDVDGGHWAIYLDVTDDPRTLQLAQAQSGDGLRIGQPIDDVDQEDQP